MYIKDIKDYDKFSGEADLIVSDGKYEILCYCFPIETCVKDLKVQSLLSLFADNIFKVKSRKYIILKLQEHFSYHLQGKVCNIKEPKINIGGLELTLDKAFPGDIKLNDFIEFDVSRIDCILNK